jgi:hypothetical protein
MLVPQFVLCCAVRDCYCHKNYRMKYIFHIVLFLSKKKKSLELPIFESILKI